MAYATYEESVESGQPVELYQFALGSDTYRYTSSELPITTAGAVLWTPEAVKRTGVVKTQTDKGDRIEVSLPSSNAFASSFLLVAPGLLATLTIWRVHRTDGALETKLYFKGAVAGIGFSENGRRAVFSIVPITSVKAKDIPRFTFQALCNYALFDADCKVSEATYTHNLPVTAVSGANLTATGAGALGADYFVNGWVVHLGEYRLIIGQSTDVLTILVPFRTSPLGYTLAFRAGYKHRLAEDCDTKFSNELNYGGFKYVPTKNPFESKLD
jgi:hypothetical protein